MHSKNFLLALTKLHALLDEINKGNDPYCQFYTLRKINGSGCEYLDPISKKVVLADSIEKALQAFVDEFHRR
jgi:hypothetical protein